MRRPAAPRRLPAGLRAARLATGLATGLVLAGHGSPARSQTDPALSLPPALRQAQLQPPSQPQMPAPAAAPAFPSANPAASPSGAAMPSPAAPPALPPPGGTAVRDPQPLSARPVAPLVPARRDAPSASPAAAPVLAQVPASTSAPSPAPSPGPASAPQPLPVRLRGGQHPDRGRLVLHLGAIPAYSLRSQGQEHELRLQGHFRIDTSGLRRPAQLADLSVQQEGEETVLRLRSRCDCQAEVGSTEGMLYVDLREPRLTRPAPSPTPREARAAGPEPVEAARQRVLEDAVRLGLLNPEQAAHLRRNPPPAPAHAAQSHPPGQRRGAAPAQPDGDLGGLRETMLSQLAILNGQPRPGAAPAPGARPGQPPQAGTTPPLSVPPSPAANPSFTAEPLPKPACATPAFSLSGWAGTETWLDQLRALRAALARSDNGAPETAALAEFQIVSGLQREALDLLSAPLSERPSTATRERLERARDIARILSRQPIDPASPLLFDPPDCARDDLPLWQALDAAVRQDQATVAKLAPQLRGYLRRMPQEFRLAFTGVLADAVEEDAETLRSLSAGIRTMTGLAPDQAALRDWILARLARLEGDRNEEALYLERAASLGRGLPALFARARLAALNATRPGAIGRRAEMQLVDLARTYRHDSLGEEASILYAQRLLDRGDLAGALAAADDASQAAARPGVESRAARMAAQALRRLLVDARGMPLPDPAQRLALYWQYEGYATPGERGDDIRLGALRLLLDQGLYDAALEIGRQLTPVVAQRPENVVLLARAEAGSSQGDPHRALALLQDMPASAETQRAASLALQKLGRPLPAAQALEGLTGSADLARRAELYFQAQAWREATVAYGEVLRDPDLPAPARAEATARLAGAAALSRQQPGVPPALLAPRSDSTALLQLTQQPPPLPGHGVGGLRAAITRSRQIETLLPAPASETRKD